MSKTPVDLSELTRLDVEAAASAWMPGIDTINYQENTQLVVLVGDKHLPITALVATAYYSRYGITLEELSWASARACLKRLRFDIVPAATARAVFERTHVIKANVRAEHVRAAASELLPAESPWQKGVESNQWLVEVDGQWFHFRQLVKAAAKHALEPELTDGKLSGREPGNWIEHLRRLTFRLNDQPVSAPVPAPVIVDSSTTLTPALREAVAKGRVNLVARPDEGDDWADKQLRDPNLPQTVKRTVRGRLGQGTFRDALLQVHGRCAVTGVTEERVLRAAHIKPWQACDDEPTARHLLANGLLLRADFDLLFEYGFIGFNRDGKILIRADWDPEKQKELGVHDKLRLKPAPCKSQQRYLAHHREVHGFPNDD